MTHLPEVSERDATPAVQAVYQDIKEALGVPVVNLIYRYMATYPDYLQAAWPELRRNLVRPEVRQAAVRLREAAVLPGVTIIPTTALQAVGVETETRRRVLETLHIYNQANPTNIMALTALLAALDGRPVRGAATREKPADDTRDDRGVLGEPPLPMTELGQASPEVWALLKEMSRPIVPAREGEVVPSLLRHFIPWPGLLALFWTVARPVLLAPAFDHAVARIAQQARREARNWPFPVTTGRELLSGRYGEEAVGQVRATWRRFTRIIPGMVVTGVLLETALQSDNG